MSNLGPQQQNQSYSGLLQVPGGVTNVLKTVQDGDGNPTGLQISSLGTNAATADSFVASDFGTPIAGAVPRLISDGFGDAVSLRDFGAIGDGVTDDTTAIEDALASGQKVIGVAGDTYLVSSTITLSVAGTQFDGGGCAFAVPDASAIVKLFAIDADNIMLSNFTVSNNPLASGFGVIVIQNTKNSVVSFVKILGDRSLITAKLLDAIYCASGDSENVLISNNYISECSTGIGYCPNGYTANSNIVSNNYIVDCIYNMGGTGTGAGVSRGNQIVENTVIVENYPAYMGIEDFTPGNYLGQSRGLINTIIRNNIIKGNPAINNTYYAISAVSSYALIDGNAIYDWVGNGGSAHIEIVGQNGAKVVNNSLEITTAWAYTDFYYGLFTASASTIPSSFNLAPTTIANNTFTNFVYGLYLHDSRGGETSIVGNSFTDCRTAIDVGSAGSETSTTSIIGNSIKLTTPATAARYAVRLLSYSNLRSILIGNQFNYSSTAAQSTYADNAVLLGHTATVIGNTFELQSYASTLCFALSTQGADPAHTKILGNSCLGGFRVSYQFMTDVVAENNTISGSPVSIANVRKSFFDDQTTGTKPTITGAKGANAALTSLLTALAGLGLLTDSTT